MKSHLRKLLIPLVVIALCAVGATMRASSPSSTTTARIGVTSRAAFSAPTPTDAGFGNQAVSNFLAGIQRAEDEAQEAAEQAAKTVAGTSPSAVDERVVNEAKTAPAAPSGFLACVRQRESNGQYAINTGNGYYGAYQFLQSTWDNTAAHAGRSDLIGRRPSDASPADQDAMAQALLAWQGTAPWGGPGC